MVGPEVESYAIIGQYIVGHTIPERNHERKQEGQSGYFIVDTVTHTESQNLNRVLWSQQLTQLGLPIPKLLPSPFENKPPLRDQ